MFNTELWTSLNEMTYKYKKDSFLYKKNILNYSVVENEIGRYYVAPAFGDFLECNQNNIETINEFIRLNNNIPLKLKLFTRLNNLKLIGAKSGYINEILYSNYDNWYKSVIRRNFRKQINQSINKYSNTSFMYDESSLFSFYKLYRNLRLSKFNSIPQPWLFFKNIYNLYFKNKSAGIFSILDKEKIVSALIFFIENDIAYIKFSASDINYLENRPNNFLYDRFIYEMDKMNIKKINLGYTGDSDNYTGLRLFKKNVGSISFNRYIYFNKKFENLDKKIIKQINKNVEKIIKEKDFEKIEKFSIKYYKYFV